MGGKKLEDGAKTLYNHPVSSAIGYFMVNLGASLHRVDSESGALEI